VRTFASFLHSVYRLFEETELDMFPVFVGNYVTHGCSSYLEHVCKSAMCVCTLCIQVTDLFNLNFCELCSTVLFTVWAVSATFLFAILRIIAMCSQKQMFGIHARWGVTLVKHAKMFKNSTVVNLPRNPVRILYRATTSVKSDTPISICKSSCSPQPTTGFQGGMNRAEFIDFFPEARDKICSDHFNLLQRLTWLCAPRLFKQFRSLFNKQVVYQFVEVQ